MHFADVREPSVDPKVLMQCVYLVGMHFILKFHV